MSPVNRKKEEPRCRAVHVLEIWMKREGFNKARIARRLDVSWETVDRILTGESRPGVDVVLKLLDLAKIPLEAWRLP